MTIFLICAFFYWIVPLWFAMRMWYFDGRFDGADKSINVLLIMLLSWFALFIAANVEAVSRDNFRRTFFLRPKGDQSMRSKMFWYKVRRFFLALLLIKEPK